MDITVSELADQIAMSKSALRKHCVAKGYRFGKRRSVASRGQAMLTVGEDDADEVRRYFAWSTA